MTRQQWLDQSALIEWKRGYFMLADRSTNGTWLKVGDDDHTHLIDPETKIQVLMARQ